MHNPLLNPDQPEANFCMTAAGCLIHDNKVLMVRHTKLGVWLNPGGHLDPGEMPHHGAEREFYEETGLRVKATAGVMPQLTSGEHSAYLLNPICTNLHWISPENYTARTQDRDSNDTTFAERGCEQHLNFMYLMRLAEGASLDDLEQHPTEVTDMAWFTEDELDNINIFENVQLETELAFQIVKSQFDGR